MRAINQTREISFGKIVILSKRRQGYTEIERERERETRS